MAALALAVTAVGTTVLAQPHPGWPGLSPMLAGLGVGVALASAPGPVQAVLLSESVRGGITRGLRALTGAGLTFGLLLTCGALGLSVAAPRGTTLAALQVIGGGFLLWLSADGLRVRQEPGHGDAYPRFSLPPFVRGALAVLLNPGAWLFLAAVASPLFAAAHQHGGTSSALIVAVVMMAGLAAGDGTVVLLGGLGVRRISGPARRWITRALAVLLAGFGVWLIATGVRSLAGA
jgi:threonine/homoserine/homoserine lactone efflux protein